MEKNTLKKLIILRGLPSWGKSTEVKKITEGLRPEEFAVCSADAYFYLKTGKYDFDHTALGAAHGYCQRLFKDALDKHVPLILIDNTNTIFKEMSFYIKMANTENYEIYLVESQAPWRNDLEECAKRNVHGVPLEAIRRMADRYQSNEVVARFALENLGVTVHYD